MSFISDILINISAFRITIGNKINALKTLIDGKANINGNNIPPLTHWPTLHAGGLDDYVFHGSDVGSAFESVLVIDQGAIFRTNKGGMQSWLGIVPTPQHRRYTVITPAFNTTGIARIKIAQQFVGMIKIHITGSYSSANTNGYIELSGGLGSNTSSIWNNQIKCTASIGQTRSALYVDPVIKRDSADGMMYFEVHKRWAANNVIPIEIELLSAISFHSSTNPFYDSFDASATVSTLVNEVSLWGLGGSGSDKIVTVDNDGTLKRSDKSLTDFQNNYLDIITTTNGTTAGTVYTFKRVGLSDLSITLTPASALFSGVVTTGAQTFEGVKTFNQIIYTANHGNSSQWKQAFDWGNHAGKYLPDNGVYSGQSINNLPKGSYYAALSNTLADAPFPQIGAILSLNNNGGQLVFSRLGQRLAYRDYTSTSAYSPWVELYHTGNFNPANYAPISSIINVDQLNITHTTSVYTFSVLLSNGVQKQATLQTSSTHFTINASGVLQLNAAIAQKIADAATVAYVDAKVAAIPTHNGQLTVNTTADLVGGYVYLPSGNLTTTLGLATHVLNAIADGQVAYSYGNHATQGYLKAAALNGYATQAWVTAQIASVGTPGNGTVVLQGIGSLAGTATFSMNQTNNVVGSFDLTQQTKAQIQKGNDGANKLDEFFGGIKKYYQYHNVSGGGTGTALSEAFFNVLNPTNVSGLIIPVDDHEVDGARLVIQGVSGTGVNEFHGRFINKMEGYFQVLFLEGVDKEYAWDAEHGRWREVF